MYGLYLEKNEDMQHLCLLYCNAKSFLWNMKFFKKGVDFSALFCPGTLY